MIEIIRISDDLNRQVWQFWPNFEIHRVDIILDGFSIQSRPTKRHGWRVELKYERGSRKDWQNGHRLITLDKVPAIPDDVVEEVMSKFVATVTVKRER